jgi:hypothetical protein
MSRIVVAGTLWCGVQKLNHAFDLGVLEFVPLGQPSLVTGSDRSILSHPDPRDLIGAIS